MTILYTFIQFDKRATISDTWVVNKNFFLRQKDEVGSWRFTDIRLDTCSMSTRAPTSMTSACMSATADRFPLLARSGNLDKKYFA